MTTVEFRTAWKACTEETNGVLVDGGQYCAEAVDFLVSKQRATSLVSWMICKLEADFMRKAKETLFTLGMPSVDREAFEACIAGIYEAFEDCMEKLQMLEVRLGIRDRSAQSSFALRVVTAMQGSVPANFSERLYGVMVDRFRVFEERGAGLPEDDASQGDVCKKLADLGFSRAVQEAITWIVFDKIDDMLNTEDAHTFEDHILPKLVRQVEETFIPWLSTVQIPPAVVNNCVLSCRQKDHASHLDVWRMQLMFHLHEKVASLRTSQIVSIIRDYPSSTPSLEDLKDCLAATDFKPRFIGELRGQFQSRLLNAGTMTEDILLQYVNMIKALRILDSTGVILESVSGPIQSYLRLRPDTIRCIVNGMTVDGDLYGELRRIPSKRRKGSPDEEDDILDFENGNVVDEDLISVDGDFDENGHLDVSAYESWTPEPIDAPSKQSGWKAGGDAIATLVSIYGTSDLLVSEYRTLLADRLIHNLEFDVGKEQRVLDLLIERFGDEAMHECSIMLGDVKNSRATLAEMNLSPKCRGDGLFETTVISKEFWPKLRAEEKFRLPEEFEGRMGLFTETFERMKEPRKLVWQEGMGSVSMKLTFDDGRSQTLSLSPLQAAILLLFQRQPKWPVSSLQTELCTENKAALTKSLASLASKGVLRPSDASASEYETLEHAEDADSNRGHLDFDAAGADEADEADERETADMKVFESYILAMLQNLKSCSLERVHNMLKLFVKVPVYDRTQDQLAGLLGRMVEEGRIECQAGMFKPKATGS